MAYTVELWQQLTHRYGCAHTRDCCGCQSFYADVRPAGRRDFIVRQSFSRNY